MASARSRRPPQPGFTTIAMICFVLLYLPIADARRLLLQCRRHRVAIWDGFSLRWFETAWNNDAGHRRLDPLAADRRHRRRRSRPSPPPWRRSPRPAPQPYRGLTFKYAFINLPLMVPEIVTAVALLIFFSRIKICDRLFRPRLPHRRPHRLLHPLRLSADPRAAGEHGPDAGDGGRRSLRDAVADLPPRDAAAAVARHPRRPDAGLRHLARRRRDHRIRQVGRPGDAADLHARPAPARR